MSEELEQGLSAFDNRDYVAAFTKLIPLAKAGNIKAQVKLGEMYANVALWRYSNIRDNEAESVKWYKLAAEAGDAKAQFNLGVMYDEGKGIPQDDAEAVKWYRLAAEAGIAGAQCRLGRMYDFGKGVPQNYTEAMKWYRLAAEAGMENAQINLGEMYANGDGVPHDNHLAYMWFTLATTQGKKPINTVAEMHRAKVAKHMTPEQIAEAQEMSRRCFAQNYKNCEQLAP